MKIYIRHFDTSKEALEFCRKVNEYGRPFMVYTMYTRNGKEYVEYWKIDGKKEIQICYNPFEEEV